MQEIEVNGVTYRTGKLDAFQQFHIFRKLSPLLSGFVESLARARTASNGAANGASPAANPDFWSAVGPVAHAMAEMTKEDSEYVLRTCLTTCQRRNEQLQWAQLTTLDGRLMFDEIDLGAMLELTYATVEDNLGNFFRGGLLTAMGAQSATPSSGPE